MYSAPAAVMRRWFRGRLGFVKGTSRIFDEDGVRAGVRKRGVGDGAWMMCQPAVKARAPGNGFDGRRRSGVLDAVDENFMEGRNTQVANTKHPSEPDVRAISWVGAECLGIWVLGSFHTVAGWFRRRSGGCSRNFFQRGEPACSRAFLLLPAPRASSMPRDGRTLEHPVVVRRCGDDAYCALRRSGPGENSCNSPFGFSRMGIVKHCTAAPDSPK